MPKRNPKSRGLTYSDAGVDVAKGDRFASAVRSFAESTRREGLIGGLGDFAGFFSPSLERFKRPVLVASTDGVGTKLEIAAALGRHEGVGRDLVAMCVNDVLVHGAEPLFFLDYIASERLDPAAAEPVVRGIASACREAGCVLLGGETAEMPGFYTEGHYDLAGFVVGIVEEQRLVRGKAIAEGDTLVGLASTGLHSNGFSLVRAILRKRKIDLDAPAGSLGPGSIGEVLLTPTRIYVRPVLALLERYPVRGMAHVTGGGIAGNLSRILPAGCAARVDPKSWERPPIFGWLAEHGPVADEEMSRTFNLGIGLILAIEERTAEAAMEFLKTRGLEPFRIGTIVARREGEQAVTFSA